MEEARLDNLVAPVFKLSDLITLYNNRLEQFGCDVTGRVHFSKLNKGCKITLVFNEDFGSALKKACEQRRYSIG